MDKTSTPTQSSPAEVTDDSGRVRLGDGYRLPMPNPAEIADCGRIRLGGGYRLPAERIA